jgi:SAM-dependent methyltransferase
MKCRHCGAELGLVLADLGTAPPSNAYLASADLARPELHFPLRVLVCTRCWLAQTEDFARADELFTADYAYFSSYSTSWLAHAERYVAEMAVRLSLGARSLVVEVAANDGYLLQYVQARGIPCLGIEPTASTAAAARAKGIPVREAFFGRDLAKRLREEGLAADLMVANNVLAHVPDINDFVAGFAALLADNGVATFEFPHLRRLVEGRQFDTIYHEHFSYLSLTTVERIFAANGLVVFDVDEMPTHGGSLRVHAQRSDCGARPRASRVDDILAGEVAAGMRTAGWYGSLQPAAERIAHDLCAWLIDCRRKGLRVGAYGAAAKGCTLLNFAGIHRDLLPWVVDANPAKQGRFLPGSRIPVVAPDHLLQERPDRVLILPWNLYEEISSSLADLSRWGGRCVRAVPELND